MRIRRRENSFSEKIHLGTSYIDITVPYGNGPWVFPLDKWINQYGVKCVRREEQTSDELHRGPPYRDGGPFSSFKRYTNEFTPQCQLDIIRGQYRYSGSHTPIWSPSSWFTSQKGWSNLDGYINNSGDDDIEQYGATGWNKFRPTRSGAELGVFLGELKDVPRMLRTTAKGFRDVWKSMGGSPTGFGPKNVANHWLNTQFGWFPFLHDLRSFYETTSNLDQKLKQLRRDNGQWVRRGGNILNETESETVYEQTVSAGLHPVPVYYLLQTPNGSGRAVYTRSRRIWFEGRFRYWIPGKPDSWQWNAKALAQIYGLRPSPSLVWELTPWSWLIDWCSNAGDAISNMDSIMYDNLAAKYAYVMGHTRHEVVYTGTTNYYYGPVTGSWRAYFDCKTRVEASPFGFGLTGIDFDARQWSILSALGLTRLR